MNVLPVTSTWLSFFPTQASRHAGEVDALFTFLTAVTGGMTLLIAALIAVFAIRYRKRPRRLYHQKRATLLWLEASWSAVPLAIFLGIFVWSARVYVNGATPPEESAEVLVVAKQWMWKIQHQNGAREINELHLPVGRTVRLLMISQDVIHSFYAPAFRKKQDVLPDRYSLLWLTPTKTGRFPLRCAEFCGTQHSRMGGEIIVMEDEAFQTWLESHGSSVSPEAEGARLFQLFGCASCHQGENANRAPDLESLYGSQVVLWDGGSAVADESYIRESIVDPAARVVGGYRPIMPVYEGRLTEEELMQLVAYIKSLAGDPPERE